MYERIKELRIENNYKQEDIAKLLGTTQSQYSRIEKGSTELLADRVILLADLYNCNCDYLLGRTNIKEPLPKVNNDEKLNSYQLEELKRVKKAKPISLDDIKNLIEEYDLTIKIEKEIRKEDVKI